MMNTSSVPCQVCQGFNAEQRIVADEHDFLH